MLEILELKQWKQISGFRLTKMRAEAYETWWSLSKMDKDDVLVTDAQMNPADFVEDSSLARERAIRAYQMLVKSNKADAEALHSLAELRVGRDTQQRMFVCYSD